MTPSSLSLWRMSAHSSGGPFQRRGRTPLHRRPTRRTARETIIVRACHWPPSASRSRVQRAPTPPPQRALPTHTFSPYPPPPQKNKITFSRPPPLPPPTMPCPCHQRRFLTRPLGERPCGCPLSVWRRRGVGGGAKRRVRGASRREAEGPWRTGEAVWVPLPCVVAEAGVGGLERRVRVPLSYGGRGRGGARRSCGGEGVAERP